MKVGITLPQFRAEAEPAIETARLAEAAGLDGVFAFDHLWPIGRPDRPAVHGLALLGALAVETQRVIVGSLVSRVGLFPDVVLVNALRTVSRMCEGRFIAGLGVGDRLSRAENEAFGVDFAPAQERFASMVECCRELRAAGMPVWVGGRSDEVREIAVAEADALNLWGVDAARVAAVSGVEVTWAGQVDGEVDLAAHLGGLQDAGATWAVCAPIRMQWPKAVDRMALAMQAL